MKRRLSATLLIAGILLLLAAIALFTRNRPDNGLSVTFHSFTNHWPGATAVFVITNQRNAPVFYSAGPGAYELKSNRAWTSPDPGSGRKNVLRVGEAPGIWDGPLQPGAWTKVTVPIPIETNVWRAAVRSYRPTGKLERLLFRLQANWRAYREHRSLPGFKGDVDGTPHSLRTNYSREFMGDSILGSVPN